MSSIDHILPILAQERLTLDEVEQERTCFFSHLGAWPKLIPGPWIAHRDLLYALALANLHPEQRLSLARAVRVEHGHEFGVGHLLLTTQPSGLPLGGSILRIQPRKKGPTCLYAWSLSQGSVPTTCDWLFLRTHPQWALDSPPPLLQTNRLHHLHALGMNFVIVVGTAVEAYQIAKHCLTGLDFTAHPRFLPYLDGAQANASIWLWPHDAMEAESLAKREFSLLILVDMPKAQSQQVMARMATKPEIQIVEASSPTSYQRNDMINFWQACGRPKILLRGDVEWTNEGAVWLSQVGAHVEKQGEPAQLGLF